MLLIAFAIHTFTRVVIVFGFYVNQEEIAAALCVNKDKPAMQCHGQCHLAKQLQQQDKKDQQSPEKALNKPFDLSSRSFFITLAHPGIKDLEKAYGMGSEGKPVHRSFTVFHPPLASVHLA